MPAGERSARPCEYAKDNSKIMTRKDHSTFTTKAQREQELDLRSKYGELGNPELVAVIRQQKPGPQPAKAATRSEQMQMAIAAREQD